MALPGFTDRSLPTSLHTAGLDVPSIMGREPHGDRKSFRKTPGARSNAQDNRLTKIAVNQVVPPLLLAQSQQDLVDRLAQ